MAQNNLLEKTKLSGAMQEITSQELQKKAEQAYKTLLFENDLSDKMQAKHLKQAILPAVAVYTTLLEDNWLKEDAFELIRKSVLDAAKPMAKAFQSMGRLPFFSWCSEKCVLHPFALNLDQPDGRWSGNETIRVQ